MTLVAANIIALHESLKASYRPSVSLEEWTGGRFYRPRRAKFVRADRGTLVFEYQRRKARGLRIHARRLKAAKRRG